MPCMHRTTRMRTHDACIAHTRTRDRMQPGVGIFCPPPALLWAKKSFFRDPEYYSFTHRTRTHSRGASRGRVATRMTLLYECMGVVCASTSSVRPRKPDNNSEIPHSGLAFQKSGVAGIVKICGGFPKLDLPDVGFCGIEQT